MFDLLKKKIGKFTENVKKKLEQKETVSKTEEKPQIAETPKEEPAPIEKAQSMEQPVEEKLIEETPIAKPVEEPTVVEPVIEEPSVEPIEEETFEEPAIEEEVVEEEPEIEAPVEELPVFEKKPEEKPKLKPKVSIRGKLKSAITGKVQLGENDLKELLWELELALLESDVEQTTAEEICGKIKTMLLEKTLSRGNIGELVKKEISEILLNIMQTEQIDLIKEIREKKEKPYKILFIGPNGAGKTTSIAKLTWLLQKNKLSVIWAAGDTFRAASIEQLEVHAKKLGVRVVKHQYGADPAAVAFDAVKSAKNKGIEVVLIDSAGRQETNKNLMGELQKIVRVAQPDMKIYVGEAFTGQTLLQQAKEYDKMVGIDGFILSKIDCDSKGGTTISLLYKIGKPILFVGTGQEYPDLQRFDPEFVLKRVVG